MRLCILFALALFQQSFGPAPRANNPAIPKQEGTQADQQKPGPGQQAPEPTAPITEPNTASNPTNQNARTITPSNEEQSVRVVSIPPITAVRDTPAFVISIVLALVGIVGIGVAVRTLVTFQRQTAHIARQAQSMRYQTTQLRIAAEATRDNVEAVIKSERAWLVATIEGTPDPNDLKIAAFISISPQIKNVERTPARIVEVIMRGHSMERDVNRYPLPPLLPDTPSYPPADSQQLIDKNILVAPNDSSRPISVAVMPETFTKAREGTIFLYIYGRIKYLDTIVNKERETGFCYLYWPENRFGSEEAGFFVVGATPKAYIYAN